MTDISKYNIVKVYTNKFGVSSSENLPGFYSDIEVARRRARSIRRSLNSNHRVYIFKTSLTIQEEVK